jgi:hypothetical protein
MQENNTNNGPAKGLYSRKKELNASGRRAPCRASSGDDQDFENTRRRELESIRSD